MLNIIVSFYPNLMENIIFDMIDNYKQLIYKKSLDIDKTLIIRSTL